MSAHAPNAEAVLIEKGLILLEDFLGTAQRY